MKWLVLLALTSCARATVVQAPSEEQHQAHLSACVDEVSRQCRHTIHVSTCTQAYETELLGQCMNRSEP